MRFKRTFCIHSARISLSLVTQNDWFSGHISTAQITYRRTRWEKDRVWLKDRDLEGIIIPTFTWRRGNPRNITVRMAGNSDDM
jgi:hypothetical protein